MSFKSLIWALFFVGVVAYEDPQHKPQPEDFTYEDRSRGYTTTYPINFILEYHETMPTSTITADFELNGEIQSVGFDFRGGGLTPAAGLEIYTKMCSMHNVMNGECAESLRDIALTKMATKLVAEVCASHERLSRCVELGTKSLFEGIAILKQAQAVQGDSEDYPVVDGSSSNNKSSRNPGVGPVEEGNGEALVKLPSFQDFESERYKGLCDTLAARSDDLAGSARNFIVEGGLWTGDIEEREVFVQTLNTVDFATSFMGGDGGGTATTKSWVYLEVGFNAGHSAAIALATFPRVVVRSFDICSHAYSRPNFDHLVGLFGAPRLSLSCGDSRLTLPRAAAAVAAGAVAGFRDSEKEGSSSNLADLVRVDGGHHFEVRADSHCTLF